MQACGEHEPALGLQGRAKLDAVDFSDQLRKRLSSLLERALTEIAALEAEKVNATNEASSPPALVRSATKSECPSWRKTTASPSIRAFSPRQGAHRLGDRAQLVGEVGSVTGPQRDAIGLLACEQPVAVVFHLMQPAWPGGRLGDKGRLAGLMKPAGGRVGRERGG